MWFTHVPCVITQTVCLQNVWQNNLLYLTCYKIDPILIHNVATIQAIPPSPHTLPQENNTIKQCLTVGMAAEKKVLYNHKPLYLYPGPKF